MRILYAILLILPLLSLGACGLKGPLYLPQEQPAPQPQTQPQTQPQPQSSVDGEKKP